MSYSNRGIIISMNNTYYASYDRGKAMV